MFVRCTVYEIWFNSLRRFCVDRTFCYIVWVSNQKLDELVCSYSLLQYKREQGGYLSCTAIWWSISKVSLFLVRNPAFRSFKADFLISFSSSNFLLKVSYFQNSFLVSSFRPKHQHVRISAVFDSTSLILECRNHR